MKKLCQEYTFPRSGEASRVRGWILEITEIGLVLDVNFCLHQKCSIEMMVESLFRETEQFLGFEL